MKEHVWYTYNGLPYKTLLNWLLVEQVYCVMFWLYSCLSSDGISQTLSPRTIVTGTKIDFNKHCKLSCTGGFMLCVNVGAVGGDGLLLGWKDG